MKLQDWELTIQQIIEASNNEPKESGKYKVLTEWRSKLAKTERPLQPFQIDEIVREVRKRLTNSSQQSNRNAQPQFVSAT
ncbi:MAG: hypothetical protein NT013_27695 [Planctomycetia bacterium]|nr:hypothetical protein [Planctomycetia bacterium]